MVKRRMIHDCLWQSEGFAALTYRQRCLWVGLITTADFALPRAERKQSAASVAEMPLFAL